MCKSCFVKFYTKDCYSTKSVKKNLFEETMRLLTKHSYKVCYVPHEVIEDYNATYNILFENKHITTNAAKKLNIPINEIWISGMWKPYEMYILFHELREIYYRADGISRNDAHETAVEDVLSLWDNDSLFHKMIKEIQAMDRKTAERKKKRSN